MVKTRHSADAGDVSFEEFVSIQSQRTRRSHQYNDQINGYDSDTSGEITLSPRRGKAGRRVVDADSSIDDATPDKPIRKDLGHNDADDERELVITGSGRATRHRPRRIVEVVEEPVMNGDFDVGTRRSTRQRKLLYSTFNQSLIEKHLDLVNDTATASSADDEVQPPRRKRRRQDVEPLKQEELGADMYTRVKRVRRQVKRDMYGMVINEDNNNQGKGNCDDGDSSDESDSTDSESDNSDEANEKEEKAPKQYFLRQHKPQTNLYTVPIEPKRTRPKNIFGRETPPRQVRVHQSTTSYRSPAHRSPFVKRRRRRPAFHGNSSTSSSSSSSDSDDGRRFERRKAKSMAKARNRCLPMNFAPEDVATGYVRDRVKIGSSLADIDPMNVDRSVSFESVGGLGKHLQALKEMIVFPLLYPEVFDRFKISPPRGVLFYGPPGTGKTLVARALANECSTGDKKVAFFMRKGADCLSKWVGESERQLRLLFDQAYQMRPSIIFFDEIDGLAPVRSSRQDQIHSSIVSTLLALMDGLDNRGEIVVIGATNRIDSIDPALRRPGRFDREFLFPLPSIEARKQILQIHTKEWNPKLCDAFMLELAGKCVGYCGADLKALCTEGALHALRRRYPQIYTSNDKLELDVTSIEVSAKDFHRGMQNIVPASQRSVTSPGRVLAPIVRPLLKRILQHTLETVERIFPTILAHINKLDAPGTSGSNGNSTSKTLELTWYSDDDDDAQPIFEQNGRGNKNRKGVATDSVPRLYLDFNSYSYQRPVTNRPRLLLSGHLGQGQSSHLGPAVLHHLERLPVFVLDLPALYAVSAKTPEESCAQIFREACRASPSIVYMPHIGHLWDVISDTLRATFIHMLRDLQPSTPILLIATCEQKHSDLHPQVQQLFDFYSEVIVMQNPNSDERREFFQDLLLNQTKKPPPLKKNAAKHMLEQLPKAKPPEPRKLTETELKKIKQQEDATLRELRLFLRDVINKLGRDRKFGIFSKPVDIEEVTDYYDIIKEPMDLSTMMSKIDLHKYQTVNEFMDNINLICSNALEYNPDKDPAGRAIRHRACALRDTTQAILAAELDPEFEKLCEEIVEARKRRGEKTGEDVPSYYFTKPLTDTMRNQLNIPSRLPQRYSRQTRGLNTDAQVEVDDMNIVNQELQTNSEPILRQIVKRIPIKRPANAAKKSPWCKPTRRRFRKVVIYVDQYGNEVKMGNTDDEQTEIDEVPQDSKKSKASDVKCGDAKQEEISDDKLESRGRTRASKEDSKVLDTSDVMSQPVEGSEDTGRVTRQGRSSTHTSPAGHSPRGAVTSSGRRTSSPYASKSPPIRFKQEKARSPPQAPSSTVEQDKLSKAESARSPRDKTRGTSKRIRTVTESSDATISPNRSTPKSGHSPCHSPNRTSSVQNSSQAQVEKNQSPGGAAGEEVSRVSGCSPSGPPSGSPTRASGSSPVRVSGSSPGRASSMQLTKTCADNSPSQPESTDPKDEKESQKEKENMEAKEESMEEDKEEENGDSPVKKRITRSQVTVQTEQRAKEVLTEPVPNMVIDEDKIKQLLVLCVENTHNFNLEQLERVYSRLSHCVFLHRNDYDKIHLTKDLETTINEIRRH